MKNFKNLKQGVFTIGFLAFLLGVFTTIVGLGPMAAFFPIYTGLFLMGMVLLHKETSVKAII